MFRKNQLRGWCAVAFGLGILFGMRISGWMLCTCLGVGFLILGLLLLRRR